MMLTGRRAAALRAAVADIPGAALRVPGDEDAAANWEAQARPAAVATAATPDGWARLVQAVRATGLPLVVRGRGWSPAGLGSAAGAVILSTAALTEVSWVAERRLRVGGGASAGMTEPVLASAGQALTMPVPSDPGVIGAALAGGVGFTLRRLGMNCDALLSATLVTAAGDVRQVDDATDPELMWALRGAGSQFGLVCAAEFETAPLGPVHVVQQVIDLASGAAALLDYDAWTRDGLTEAVTSVAMARNAPPLPGVPAAAVGRPALLLTSVHTGSEAAAERDLAPLRGLPGVLAERRLTTTLAQLRAVTDAPFRSVTGSRANGNGARFGIRTASGWSAGLTPAAAEALTVLAAEMPPGESIVEVAAMGGAAAHPARPSSAPGRDARHLLNVMAIWTDQGQRDAHLRWAAWARQTVTVLRAGTEISPSFTDLADLGRPGCYGAATARLRAVKERLDPDRAFGVNLTLDR
ncbi:MAG TPA: FAD-binding protein [Trebonia sp.]|nr:FAD-binding protein [Trebonia sp.]